MNTQSIVVENTNQAVDSTRIKYCLYARKSTESDEKQALSIDSQIKEMLELAKKENLNIVDIKRESHSSKDVGQRPIFNQMIAEIKEDEFNAILAWHPDRLSRNAGDLGALVDLMDQKKIIEIRTYGQRFTNNPSEKFLLMILGSQAKLENDNKSVNVKRGLKAKCEMGLWPSGAPTGYLNSRNLDEKGIVYVDKARAPIIRKMFEKVAYEDCSGRRLFYWLKEIKFTTKTKKTFSLSNIYLVLNNTFYYGMFEYPRGSGRWYKGRHEPIISKELFDLVQEKTTRSAITIKNREFAFTKLLKCGLCGSGITATEKFKHQKNGNVHRYVYYGCTKFNDKDCKCGYISENELIVQIEKILEKIDLDETGIKNQLKTEVEKMKKFQAGVLGIKDNIEIKNIEVLNYAKYILRDGSNFEKRNLMNCLKSRLVLKDKEIRLG